MIETYAVEWGDNDRTFGVNRERARSFARRMSEGPAPAYLIAHGPGGRRVVDRYDHGVRQDIKWEAA